MGVLSAELHSPEDPTDDAQCHEAGESNREEGIELIDQSQMRELDAKARVRKVQDLEARLRKELAGIDDEAARAAKETQVRAEIDAAHAKVKAAGGLLVVGTELSDTDLYNGALPTDGYGYVTFANISATLDPNTRYWIVATDSCSFEGICDHTMGLWDQADSPFDASVNLTPTEYEWAFFQGGSFWAGGGTPFIDSTPFIMSITTAPEPATA